jgi:transcriptional regulator with GAF, ATPase, and Fis domain
VIHHRSSARNEETAPGEPGVPTVPQELPLSFVELLFRKLDPEKFQKRFLQILTKVQNVERGSIWIWVRQDNRFVCTEATGEEASKVKGVAVSADVKSVVGEVINSGKMIVAEPDKSPYFRGVEKKLDTKNTLILCFPLTRMDGTVYGAIQILDTNAGGGSMNLDSHYLELLEGLVTIGGIALSTSLDLADQQEQNVRMKELLEHLRSSPPMIGQSEAYLKVKRAAEIYAANDFPVMITGESGTGKELIAREIHRFSARGEKPFLIQNCSAIPDTLLESELFGYKKGAFTGADRDKSGLFEAADGGTVFLDEIGDMPVGLQGKILRVLQSSEIKPLGTTHTRHVDVRIIAATNRDLEIGIVKGTFREDLFYRLNVLPLRMPALRERRDDIPLLLTHFMKHFALGADAAPKVFSPEVLEKLSQYQWPGNIRQMENLVKYLLTVARGDTVGLTDLPPLPSSEKEPRTAPGETEKLEKPAGSAGEVGRKDPPADDLSMDSMERAHILSLLEKTRWNVTAAAGMAGLKRTTLTSRMKRLGISRK